MKTPEEIKEKMKTVKNDLNRYKQTFKYIPTDNVIIFFETFMEWIDDKEGA